MRTRDYGRHGDSHADNNTLAKQACFIGLIIVEFHDTNYGLFTCDISPVLQNVHRCGHQTREGGLRDKRIARPTDQRQFSDVLGRLLAARSPKITKTSHGCRLACMRAACLKGNIDGDWPTNDGV